MTNGIKRFYIDIPRLTEVCARAYKAYEEGAGFFRDKKRFLPQWNLPQELEFSPQREETRSPEMAGNYLWLLALLEKRSQSRENIRNGLRVYNGASTRWIFNPFEVVKRTEGEIREILSQGFRYNLNDFLGNLIYNDEKLVRDYGGSAINVVHGNSVEEARRNLMEFKGIGSGISNLFILYLIERKIADLKNPEEIRMKIDIHKSRIPANTGAIVPLEKKVKRDTLVPLLEESYLQICKKRGFNPIYLDAAIWIIGSEGCAKRDYRTCVSCPLEEICQSCVREDDSTGELIIFDEKGERIEMRKGTSQRSFNF